jgi:hypothetical protein
MNLPPNIKPDQSPQQVQKILQETINKFGQEAQKIILQQIIKQSPEIGVDIRIYGGRWIEYDNGGTLCFMLFYFVCFSFFY